MAFILQLFHQLLDRTKTQMFRERSHVSSELLEMAIARVNFDENDDTMNFDYRDGQPALFGANETANSSSAVEPAYVEEEVAPQEVIDLTDFHTAAPKYASQYLLTESDFATKTQDCLDKLCEPAFLSVGSTTVAPQSPKKTAKSAKTTKKSRAKSSKPRSKRKK